MKTLQTSQDWYNEVLSDVNKFKHWLERQYIGEVTASTRIRAIADEQGDSRSKAILETIAGQEDLHATWVASILAHYGYELPEIPKEGSRYWDTVEEVQEDFFSKCAIASHAEGMRLERIRVICNDPRTNEFVRDIFQKILKDEVWHETAFRSLAGEDAMASTKPCHVKAKNLLGLEA